MHSKVSGLSDYFARDEHEAIRMGRDIVSHLNWRKQGYGPTKEADDPIHDIDHILGVIPADLRVDDVYLVSCKYESRNLLNSGPSKLFDQRLKVVLPVTLFLVVMLLYLNTRSFPKTFIVLFLTFWYIALSDKGQSPSLDFAGWYGTATPAVIAAYAAIGAVVATDRVMEPFLESTSIFSHGITFGGHPTMCAIALKNNQYIRLIDTRSGTIRVERGEQVGGALPRRLRPLAGRDHHHPHRRAGVPGGLEGRSARATDAAHGRGGRRGRCGART